MSFIGEVVLKWLESPFSKYKYVTKIKKASSRKSQPLLTYEKHRVKITINYVF